MPCCTSKREAGGTDRRATERVRLLPCVLMVVASACRILQASEEGGGPESSGENEQSCARCSGLFDKREWFGSLPIEFDERLIACRQLIASNQREEIRHETGDIHLSGRYAYRDRQRRNDRGLNGGGPRAATRDG